jgi:hypothetical protein
LQSVFALQLATIGSTSDTDTCPNYVKPSKRELLFAARGSTKPYLPSLV